VVLYTVVDEFQESYDSAESNGPFQRLQWPLYAESVAARVDAGDLQDVVSHVRFSTTTAGQSTLTPWVILPYDRIVQYIATSFAIISLRSLKDRSEQDVVAQTLLLFKRERGRRKYW
jgi:hypothetical protein